MRIITGNKTTTLSPGHCTILTCGDHGFERVNPMWHVGYKNVVDARHGDGIKSFSAQFSTLQAIGSVKPLAGLFASKHAAAKSMSAKLMKTAAVLMHLGSAEEFQFFVEPSVTAMRK